MENESSQSNINTPQIDYKEQATERKRVSISMIIASILLITNLIVIFYAWFSTNKLNSEIATLNNNKSQLESDITNLKDQNGSLLKENENLSKELEDYIKKENDELYSQGIHPDPIEIKVITLNGNWQANEILFEFSKAYFASDLVDLGGTRGNTSVKNKDFITIEIKIKDLRTSGERREIDPIPYIRLEDKSRISSPLFKSYNYLYPIENDIAYATFAVEKNQTSFNLLSGLPDSLQTNALDFNGPLSKTLAGVLSFKEGYSETYITD